MKKIFEQNGTTLVEVIISMVIIAITAMGGIALYFNSAELKTLAVHKKMAIELANSKMEEVRDMSYTHTDLDFGTTTVSDVTIGGLTITNGMTLTVPPNTGSGFKEVQVDIDWQEAGQINRNFNVSLITYKRP